MPAIHAICGLPGAGKTAFMSLLMLRRRRRQPERRIVANYPLYLPGREVEFVSGLREVMSVTDADVCIDEMHVWLSARDWRNHGNEFNEWASQLRKSNIDLWYTSQDINSVDRFIRVRTLDSFWVTSWRKLGFFVVDCFMGVENKKNNRTGVRIFPVSEVLFACYDTDYVVRL